MKRLILCIVLIPLNLTWAGNRVALVIGCNRYANLPDSKQLTSPVADATDVAATLKALGYALVTGAAVTDVGRNAIITSTESFAAQAKDADAAVFYFSGHGIQVGGDNFLVPSDTPRITSYTVLKNRGVHLREAVMVALEEAKAKTKVIVLDCCRENPFASQVDEALGQIGKSLKTKGGLGEISGYGPGFFLAFATSPGTLAGDGNGQRNSPFTAALLTHLKTSAGEDITPLFRKVKASVRQSNGEHQVPWTNDSLDTGFIFGLSSGGTSASAQMSNYPPAPAPASLEPMKKEPDASADSDMKGWAIMRYGERDFVSAGSIQKFYRFNNLDEEGKTVSFRSPVLLMKATLGSQDLLINNVKFVLSEPVVELNGKAYFSRLDLCKLIDPVLRPSYIGKGASFDTVIIDAAHGGHDAGAHGIYGEEKDYTLKLALSVKADLEKRGVKVLLTRPEDAFVSLGDRVALANQTPNSIFVSLQFNSGEATETGVETFALAPQGASSSDSTTDVEDSLSFAGNERDSENIALATAIHAAAVHHFKMVDRGVKRGRRDELKGIEKPGAVFVGGFVTNPNDAKFIAADNFRLELASTLGQAIMNYRKALTPRPKVGADLAQLQTRTYAGTEVTADSIQVTTSGLRAQGRVQIKTPLYREQATATASEVSVAPDGEITLRGKPKLQRGRSIVEGLNDATVFYIKGTRLQVVGEHRTTKME